MTSLNSILGIRVPLGSLGDARAILRALKDPAALGQVVQSLAHASVRDYLENQSPELLAAIDTHNPSDASIAALARLLLRRSTRTTPFPGLAAIGVARVVTVGTELPPRPQVEYRVCGSHPLDPAELHFAVPSLVRGTAISLVEPDARQTIVHTTDDVLNAAREGLSLPAKSEAVDRLSKLGVVRKFGSAPTWARGYSLSDSLVEVGDIRNVNSAVSKPIDVPPAIATLLAERNRILKRVARTGSSPRFRAFHNQWLDRFGLEPVPLPTACQPDRSGLPFPWQMSEPLVAADPIRESWLREVISAQRNGVTRLKMADAMALPPAPIPRPGAETSALVVVDGKGRPLFSTFPGAYGGTVGAFRSLGRQMGSLPQLREHVIARQKEWESSAGVLQAEVRAWTTAESEHLTRLNHGWSCEVLVSGPRGERAARGLSINSLFLRADAEGFSLLRGNGEVIEPHFGHVLEPGRMALPARLLHFLFHSGRWMPIDFSWGELSTQPCLPRVEVGWHVLSLSTWRLPPHSASASDVEGWRRMYGIPQIVTIGRFDQRVPVDLETDFGRNELRRASKHADAIAQEIPWLDEPNANLLYEFVTQFSPPGAPRRAARPLCLPEIEPADVTEWAYLRLILNEQTQRRLMREALPLLVEGAFPNWHFVRYATATRPELRLRWQGRPDEFLRLLNLPVVSAIGGAEWSLQPFHPETWRYGGPAAFELALALFHADSLAAANVWTEARDGMALLLSTAQALAAAALQFERVVLPERILRVPRSSSSSRQERGLRKQVSELARGKFMLSPDLAEALEKFALQLSGLPDERVVLATNSVLHMMANRRLGLRFDLEQSARGLATTLLHHWGLLKNE